MFGAEKRAMSTGHANTGTRMKNEDEERERTLKLQPHNNDNHTFKSNVFPISLEGWRSASSYKATGAVLFCQCPEEKYLRRAN